MKMIMSIITKHLKQDNTFLLERLKLQATNVKGYYYY